MWCGWFVVAVDGGPVGWSDAPDSGWSMPVMFGAKAR